jgi:hypothetical protein
MILLEMGLHDESLKIRRCYNRLTSHESFEKNMLKYLKRPVSPNDVVYTSKWCTHFDHYLFQQKSL